METQSDRLPDWTINGSANSSGGSFRNVIIRGDAVIHTDLRCEKLRLMGSLRVGGHLQMAEAKLTGSVQVDGNVTSQSIRVVANLSVDGDCSAELFKCRGAFQIDGMLNAGEIDIILHGASRVKEIGGGSIHMKPHFKLVPGGMRELVADTIEGDDVRLLNTRARVVRGNTVSIGSGCEIELVEYKTSCQVDRNAIITRRVKV